LSLFGDETGVAEVTRRIAGASKLEVFMKVNEETIQ